MRSGLNIRRGLCHRFDSACNQMSGARVVHLFGKQRVHLCAPPLPTQPPGSAALPGSVLRFFNQTRLTAEPGCSQAQT